jgi:hypothetical protein
MSKSLFRYFGVTSREFLSNYNMAEDILYVDTNTLTEFLSNASKGRFSILKTMEIKDSTKNTFGINLAKMPLFFKSSKLLPKSTLLKSN